MPKNEVQEPVEAPASVPVDTGAVEPITLDEFCLRLSKSDKRVELIGGFHHSETSTGVVKDAEAAFKARYDAFANKPA